MRLRGVWPGLLLAMLLVAVAWGDGGPPQFRYAYGQPAIGDIGAASSLPLAADGSHIYVGTGDVTVFDRNGNWVGFWPISSPARGLTEPSSPTGGSWTRVWSLGIDARGAVYVFDLNYGAVHRYDRTGKFVGAWSANGAGPGRFSADLKPMTMRVAPDSSLYFLCESPLETRGTPTAGAGIVAPRVVRSFVVRYSATGEFLGQFEGPRNDSRQRVYARDIAPAADGGVWLLSLSSPANSGDCFPSPTPPEMRVHRYSLDGTELATWAAPGAYGLAADPQGNVWTLDIWAHPARLAKHRPTGELMGAFSLSRYDVGIPSFTITQDGLVLIASQARVPGRTRYDQEASFFQLEVRDLEGRLLTTMWDLADLTRRGALMAPADFAATPQGDVYVRTPDLRAGMNCISQYAPEGILAKVIETEAYPIYNPARGKVEFTSRHYDAADKEGRYYLVTLRQDDLRKPYDTEPKRQWSVSLSMYLADETPLLEVPVISSTPEQNVMAWGQPALAAGADGNLRLVIAVAEPIPGAYGPASAFRETIRVYTLTPEGRLLGMWREGNYLGDSVSSVFVDSALNVYVGGSGGVWKYSAAGQPLGRIGTWGKDSLGSLIRNAQALHVDGKGRLRVLESRSWSPSGDSAARILVFSDAR